MRVPRRRRETTRTRRRGTMVDTTSTREGRDERTGGEMSRAARVGRRTTTTRRAQTTRDAQATRCTPIRDARRSRDARRPRNTTARRRAVESRHVVARRRGRPHGDPRRRRDTRRQHGGADSEKCVCVTTRDDRTTTRCAPWTPVSKWLGPRKSKIRFSWYPFLSLPYYCCFKTPHNVGPARSAARSPTPCGALSARVVSHSVLSVRDAAPGKFCPRVRTAPGQFAHTPTNPPCFDPIISI